MKKAVLILFLILSLSVVSAINLDIQKEPVKDTIIKEISEPAVFNFTIKNENGGDDFEIYSLVGVSFSPKGTFYIGPGKTENLEVKVYPRKNLRKDSGYVFFTYEIRGVNTGNQKDKISIKIVDLKDAFDIYTEKIHPDNEETTLYIQNKENYDFDSLTFKISSEIFDLDTGVSLGPYETRKFTIELDKEKLKTLTAGQYPINVQIIEPSETEFETTMEILEKKYISVREAKAGLLIREKHILKTNEGSLEVIGEVKDKKNIISRLFTTFNTPPDKIERKGLNIYYSWQKSLMPSESLDVIIKTNYTFPFLLLFGLVIIIWLIKATGRKELDIDKKISFVRTKTGMFALKVNVKVKANRYVEKVTVIDKLPPVVKLLERFSSYSPDKVDKQNRRLIWNFSNLAEGEERIMSYIVYSKIGILGKFGLPPAVCVFEIENQVYEVKSNKVYFVAEQAGKND